MKESTKELPEVKENSVTLTAELKQELLDHLNKTTQALKESWGGKPGYNPFIAIRDHITPVFNKVTELEEGVELTEASITKIKSLTPESLKHACKVKI